jgi:hypothetical protein
VSKERGKIFFPASSLSTMTNLLKGEQIMFKSKEQLEMLEKIDKKLSQIIAILNRDKLNAKKGVRKDV